MIPIIKFIDSKIGGMLCSFFGVFARKKNVSPEGMSPKKLLVIQLWGIGETILTLPAIEALRKKFPDANLDVLCTSRNMLVYSGNSNIDNLITVKINPFSLKLFVLKNFRRYDLVVDMEEYLNSSALLAFFTGKSRIGYSQGVRSKLYTSRVNYNDGQHAVQTFLDLVRILNIKYDTSALPKLEFSESDKKFVEKFLKSEGIKKNDFIVCIAPGTAESAKSRRWPAERYSELCDEIIIRYNAKIMFVGTSEENNIIQAIIEKMENKPSAVNSSGRMKLKQLFCLIKKSEFFVGNDAGPMHIAAAQGIRTIGLFGPNLPARFGPYGKGNIGVYKGYNCEFSPCINVHKAQVPNCFYPRDSNDYQKCMKNIGVDDVLKSIESIVKPLN